MSEVNLSKRIHQSRPDMVLSIGNEYLTRNLMGELATLYTNTALNAPKRHFLTRFIRNLKDDARSELDYIHYTVPLVTD